MQQKLALMQGLLQFVFIDSCEGDYHQLSKNQAVIMPVLVDISLAGPMLHMGSFSPSQLRAEHIQETHGGAPRQCTATNAS